MRVNYLTLFRPGKGFRNSFNFQTFNLGHSLTFYEHYKINDGGSKMVAAQTHLQKPSIIAFIAIAALRKFKSESRRVALM